MKNKYLLLILFFICTNLLFSKSKSQAFDDNNNEYSLIIFFSNSCPICQYYTKVLNELKIEYPEIKFNLVFPGNFSKKTIRKFKVDYAITQNIIIDKKYRIVKKYKATITPQVFLIKNNEVIYEGLIDDSFYEIGRRKQTGINYYLQDALHQLKQNKIIITPKTQAIGCLIN
jgi:thiol-disulfide isomerase/thioredoxin